MSTKPFRINNWRVDPKSLEIRSAEKSFRVGPKVMQVLILLAGKPGEVVTRDEFLEEIWEDSHVVEESLTRCVSELRRILRDDPAAPKIIETIRGVGYRLVAPVLEAAIPGKEAVLPREFSKGGRWSWPDKKISAISLGILLLAVSTSWVFTNWVFDSRSDPVLEMVPLSSSPGRERDPALSPDGSLVAYSWQEQPGDSADLYLRVVGNSQSQRITDSLLDDRSPAWSPNGRQLAFMRYGGDARCRIFLYDLDSGKESEWASCGRNFLGDLAWSPDGRWLAYSSNITEEGPSGIYAVSRATGKTRLLTFPGDTRYGDADPAFSPDGRRLSFVRAEFEESRDLYLLDLQSGEEKRLTFDQRLLRGHTWTSTGEIVFSSKRTGRFQLWRLSLDGPLRLLTNGTGNLTSPSAGRTSNRLVFTLERNQTHVWQASIDGASPPRLLLGSTRNDLSPNPSPDGEWIAFVSDRSGFSELWISRSDGQDTRQLTSLTGPLVSSPRWSPDGTSIVFEARPEGNVDLFLVTLEDKRVRRLTADSSDEVGPTWSRDGKSLYFGSDRDGEWQLWQMELGNRKMRKATHYGGIFGFESPEGETLFFTKRDQDGIWQLKSGSKQETLLIPDLCSVDWGNWQIRDQSLYYLRRTGTPAFMRYDLETGDSETLLQFGEKVLWTPVYSMPSLALTANGESLIYAQVDRLESDIYLMELR